MEYAKRKANEEKEAQKRDSAKMNREEIEREKLKKRYEHFMQEKAFFDSIDTKDIQ